MAQKRDHLASATPNKGKSLSQRQRWVLGLTAFAALFALSWGLREYMDSPPRAGSSATAAASPIPVAATPPAAPSKRPMVSAPKGSVPPALRERLGGRWRRTDGGYVMTIGKIADNGNVQIEYHNPQPIHVSKSMVLQAGDATVLAFELRDRNYPGNNYQLEFDTTKDQFVGVYHHLGVQQDFDVTFERMK